VLYLSQWEIRGEQDSGGDHPPLAGVNLASEQQELKTYDQNMHHA